MSKCYLAPILLTLLACANSASADYLLRLEVAELCDLPNGKQEPDARTSETIEILVHPGKAFYTTITNGTVRVLVNGKLEEANDGTQLMQVKYRKTSASGETIPGINGQRLPISNAIEIKTDVIPVTLGKAVEFDGKVSRHKQVRATLTVSKFDPSQSLD